MNNPAASSGVSKGIAPQGAGYCTRIDSTRLCPGDISIRFRGSDNSIFASIFVSLDFNKSHYVSEIWVSLKKSTSCLFKESIIV